MASSSTDSEPVHHPPWTQIASSSTRTSSAASSNSSSGLSSVPSPILPSPSLQQHHHHHQNIGIGRPPAPAPLQRFDSLHDLLTQAGYKHTRVITPQSINATHPSPSPPPATLSAAQLALTSTIRSHSLQHHNPSHGQQAATAPTGWLSSFSFKPRRTISTSVLSHSSTQTGAAQLPHSSSDPVLAGSSTIPLVSIDPSSPRPTIQDIFITPEQTASSLGPPSSQQQQRHKTLRKRASRTSHALWTGSLAHRASQQTLRVQAQKGAQCPGPRRAAMVAALPTATHRARARPSLQAAFASSPTKTRSGFGVATCDGIESMVLSAEPEAYDRDAQRSSAGEDEIKARRAEFQAQYESHRRPQPSSSELENTAPEPGRRSSSSSALMAHPALPILSAAPAVALRHEACLIPASAPTIGPPASLGRTGGVPIAAVTTASATSIVSKVDDCKDDGDDGSGLPREQGEAAGSQVRPGLGRMRSVDLLRDALDAMLRIQDSDIVGAPEAQVAAVDEVVEAVTSLSFERENSSPDDTAVGHGSQRTTSSGETLVVAPPTSKSEEGQTSLDSHPSLPKLFLSSPRGISGPRRIGDEEHLDPPADEPVFKGGGAGGGLGFSFFSLFGRRPRSSSLVESQAGRQPAVPRIVVDNGRAAVRGMISSESIEAELDRIFANTRIASSHQSPTKGPYGRPATAAATTTTASSSSSWTSSFSSSAAAGESAFSSFAPVSTSSSSSSSASSATEDPRRPVICGRRSSADSLEVINPLRVRGRRPRRSRRDGSDTTTSSQAQAESESATATTTRSRSSSLTSLSSGQTVVLGDSHDQQLQQQHQAGGRRRQQQRRSMSPCQLDRIESVLRGHAGTLSGARAGSVSALRSGVSDVRAARRGGDEGGGPAGVELEGQVELQGACGARVTGEKEM